MSFQFHFMPVVIKLFELKSNESLLLVISEAFWCWSSLIKVYLWSVMVDSVAFCLMRSVKTRIMMTVSNRHFEKKKLLNLKHIYFSISQRSDVATDWKHLTLNILDLPEQVSQSDSDPEVTGSSSLVSSLQSQWVASTRPCHCWPRSSSSQRSLASWPH